MYKLPNQSQNKIKGMRNTKLKGHKVEASDQISQKLLK